MVIHTAEPGRPKNGGHAKDWLALPVVTRQAQLPPSGLPTATPLVRGVFQHGAFTAADTFGTAGALAAFSVGVPAYVLIKVLTPGFYARQDTKTPVRLAVVSMLVNLAGNLLSVLVWRVQLLARLRGPLQTRLHLLLDWLHWK